jgi:hypothetical protein
MTDFARSARTISPLADEVAGLLWRYDRLRPHETERLLDAFKRLTALDVALMTSDEALRGRLDAFRRDHKSQLRPPLWHVALFLGTPVAMLAAVIWGLWQTAGG